MGGGINWVHFWDLTFGGQGVSAFSTRACAGSAWCTCFARVFIFQDLLLGCFDLNSARFEIFCSFGFSMLYAFHFNLKCLPSPFPETCSIIWRTFYCFVTFIVYVIDCIYLLYFMCIKIMKLYRLFVYFVYFGCWTNQRSSCIECMDVTVTFPPRIGHMTCTCS